MRTSTLVPRANTSTLSSVRLPGQPLDWSHAPVAINKHSLPQTKPELKCFGWTHSWVSTAPITRPPPITFNDRGDPKWCAFLGHRRQGQDTFNPESGPAKSRIWTFWNCYEALLSPFGTATCRNSVMNGGFSGPPRRSVRHRRTPATSPDGTRPPSRSVQR